MHFWAFILLFSLFLGSGCGGSLSQTESAGGEGVSAEEAASTRANSILKTAASGVTETVLPALNLSQTGLAGLSVKNSATVLGACTAGMTAIAACDPAGAAEMASDCRVTERGADTSLLEIKGRMQFNACGPSQLSGPVDFVMTLGPIPGACLLDPSCPAEIPFHISLASIAGETLSEGDGGADVTLDVDFNGVLKNGEETGSFTNGKIVLGVFLCPVGESAALTIVGNPVSCLQDTDGDGVVDTTDNCPTIPNPRQADEDRNGVGDLCEPVHCGNGCCEPDLGECAILGPSYCPKDCDETLCKQVADGLLTAGDACGIPPNNGTCGNGKCDPLNGECSDASPCFDDCCQGDKCPNEDLCFPDTCGNNICEPWEQDAAHETFCINDDCACIVNRSADNGCQTDSDCASEPGTHCRSERFPTDLGEPDFIDKLLAIPCHCTTCGNGTLDEGEECDLSAVDAVDPCVFPQVCDEFTCGCKYFFEWDCYVEYNPSLILNGIDDDGDGLVDCADPDCQFLLSPCNNMSQGGAP
jgi:thrombospondin type 3 repeat protein